MQSIRPDAISRSSKTGLLKYVHRHGSGFRSWIEEPLTKRDPRTRRRHTKRWWSPIYPTQLEAHMWARDAREMLRMHKLHPDDVPAPWADRKARKRKQARPEGELLYSEAKQWQHAEIIKEIGHLKKTWRLKIKDEHGAWKHIEHAMVPADPDETHDGPEVTIGDQKFLLYPIEGVPEIKKLHDGLVRDAASRKVKDPDDPDRARSDYLGDLKSWGKRVLPKLEASQTVDPTLQEASLVMRFYSLQKNGETGTVWDHRSRCKTIFETFGAKTKLSKVTPAAVLAWSNARAEKIDDRSVNKELTCLKSLYAAAEEYLGHDGKCPVKRGFRRKTKKTKLRRFSVAEINAFLAKVEGVGTDISRHHANVIRFVMSIHGRTAELCKVRIEDIDWKARTMTLREGDTKEKSKGDRVYHLDAMREEIIRSLLGDRTQGTILNLQPTSLTQIFKRYGESLGVVAPSPRDVRHAMDNESRPGFSDLEARAALGGHGRETQAKHYVTPTCAQREEQALVVAKLMTTQTG